VAQGAATASLDFVRRFVHLRLMARGGHDIRASLGQTQAQCAANSRGSADHDRNFSIKTLRLNRHVFLLFPPPAVGPTATCGGANCHLRWGQLPPAVRPTATCGEANCHLR